MSKDRLVVLAGARTPQAKAFGALASVSAVELGHHALASLLKKAHLQPKAIDEVVFGNVSGPPDAANIGRVIALAADIPPDRIAHTVNRNCASGMESIVAAWHALRESRARLIVAGGTESMSSIPMIASTKLQEKLLNLGRAKTTWQRLRGLARLRPADLKLIPAIQLGLTDPTCGLNMGETAEVLAAEFGITREEQDAFALESHRRAVSASKRCFLSGEISAMQVSGKELKQDVGPRDGQSLEQLAKLKPIFKSAEPDRSASVTPGNSCPLTDGAAALLLASEAAMPELDMPPLGYISAYAIAGCDPRRMGLGPVFATAKLLKATGLSLSDIDLIELNEAFAAQVIACMRAFESKQFANNYLNQSYAIGEICHEKLNINGGAIALGHPVGASGTRIVLTLLRALREKGLRRGLATLCVGGGQGVAMLVEVE